MDLHQLMIQEIEKADYKRIPFSRFMDLALYHPTQGYYMKERTKLGKSGDFFTNVHVGSIFGQALSRYFLTVCPHSSTPWALVEMGAGDGRLIEQVCNGFLEAGVHPNSIHVYLIEASLFHQQVQKERLRDSPFSIQWVSHVSDIPSYPFCVVYSNELVDAFPLHRVKRISSTEMAELYITWDKSKHEFVEVWGPLSNEELEGFIHQFEYHLDIGQSVEVNLSAKKFIYDIAEWMKSGYILTIDYGATTQELLMRKDGTIRYFYQHSMPENPYTHIGEVDITCHVNFDTLQTWGEEVGLETIRLSTQSQFLLQSGILDMLSGKDERDPFSEEAKKRRAVQQLIHPDAMGETFKVLVQRKD